MPRKPPPFKRASIDMNRAGRTWQHVKAKHLEKDDVVSERGLITNVVFAKRAQQVEVSYFNGNTDFLEPDELIFAFTREVKLDG